jgi:K+-transporting ATPase ATPase C chain
MNHLRSNLWLLLLSITSCCVVYPLLLLGIGKAAFSESAEGSVIRDSAGNPIGSRLVAQPFTGDQWFQPRPSAVGYNAAATGGSNWGSANPLLRDRVARQLGPIVRYSGGAKSGERVGPDVERWFRDDRFGGKPGLVAQWAEAHPMFAANWVKSNPANAAFVAAWQEMHPEVTAEWKRANPESGHPKPEDLAVPFFVSFSKESPGLFPAASESAASNAKGENTHQPSGEGIEIQAMFFDMWRQEHPDAELESVPADMVMASGSGIDPHITLKNARCQLERVAAMWAAATGHDIPHVRRSLETLLNDRSESPLGGLAGVPLVNVLEINLAVRGLFEPHSAGTR